MCWRKALKHTAMVPCALAAGALALVSLSGCDPIGEPWVQNEEQLRAERDRTPEERQRLRERALAVQTDR